MNSTGYVPGNAPASGSSVDLTGAPPSVVDHEKLKKDYLSYLDNKTEEIKEQKDARRYYHSSQWTEKAIREFKRRKQPVVTYNREAKKINAIIGLLERQRQDPRAYPRTPKQEDGAEIATATIRYVVDEQRWKEKSPIAALNGAVDGIGGIEIIIEKGDQGDPEVGFETVEPSSFFYDPRSLKADFSDARWMGVAKWADIGAATEMFPDKAEEIKAAAESGQELTSNPDSDGKWVMGQEGGRKVRIVDHWYIEDGEWSWCIYLGGVKLDDGPSYLKDEKGKTFCKYIMFSANVDHDGDRYGFHRGMKSAQDEINQRRSKGLHTLNSRRMTLEKGSVDDPEKTRQEAVRPDGVIVYNPGTTPPEFDDAQRQAEVSGQLEFLQDAKDEIDNYGFNPSLMGTGVGQMSGKAIELQQAAGIAELGPYLLSWRGWKLRVYRAIWDTIQGHWTAERWIRVTDDENMAQFFAINQQQKDQFGNPIVDPATGQPALVNHLGSLDVDVIIDEGPDAITMEADTFETMKTMAQSGIAIPPELLIEMSPLPGSQKKKYLDMLAKQGQDPVKQAATKLELEGKQAQNAKVMSEVQRNQAQAAAHMQGNGQDQGAQLAFDKWHALLEAWVSVEVARIGAGSDMDSAMIDARLEAMLGLSGLQNDQIMQLRDHAHQQVMTAMQPPAPTQPAQ